MDRIPYVQAWPEGPYLRIGGKHYFGSHCTYPLLVPLTSLTTSSNVSKSRAVTASKATSNRMSAHSKKA